MRRQGDSLRSQTGAVAIIVALALAVLVGFVGLALDAGHLFVVKTEVQNAVDACALAAAEELYTTPTTLAVLTRAENAGITTGSRNRVDFQGEDATLPTDSAVTFSATLNGAYAAKSSAPSNSRYARCTAARSGIAMWFIQTLNLLPGVSIGAQTVSATAVASLQGSTATCAFPLGICQGTPGSACPPPAPPGAVADKYGLCPGKWYQYDQNNITPGWKGWIDFNPSTQVSDLRNYIQGAGMCGSPTAAGEPLYVKTGKITTLDEQWNSRFGLYKQGGGGLDVASAQPDFSGYGYGPSNWPQGYGAAADFAGQRVAYASYAPSACTNPAPPRKTFSAGTVEAGNCLTGLDVQTNYTVCGASACPAGVRANRRLVPLPVVNCGATTLAGYACMLMIAPTAPSEVLTFEYLGPADDPGSPCATFGPGGGPGGPGPRVPNLVQ